MMIRPRGIVFSKFYIPKLKGYVIVYGIRQYLRRMIALRGWELLNENPPVVRISGHILRMDPPFFDTMFNEWISWRTHYLPKNGIKDFNILDVGAGCGETALFFLLHGAGHITCVEPEAGRVRILRENATRNHWPLTIIDRPFSLEMLTPDIDFLKMDCEGCESALLSVKVIPSCALEVHKWELCQELCTKFDLRVIEKFGPNWILRTR